MFKVYVLYISLVIGCVCVLAHGARLCLRDAPYYFIFTPIKVFDSLVHMRYSDLPKIVSTIYILQLIVMYSMLFT